MVEFFQALIGLTLFGSIIWSGIFLIFLLFIFFVSETEENGWLATVFLVIIGAIFFFFSKGTYTAFISLFSWQFFVYYFSFGIVHAIVRIFFHGRAQIKEVNRRRLEGSKWASIDEYDGNIKEHIFRWWFLWPVSLLVWIIKDMVREIYDWCYKKMSKVFNYIFELGIKSIKEVPVQKEEK